MSFFILPAKVLKNDNITKEMGLIFLIELLPYITLRIFASDKVTIYVSYI